MSTARPAAAFALTHPAHAIALGFGAGLVPVAPGTFGTVLGWGLWLLLGGMQPVLFLLTVAVFFALGVWACERTGRDLGVADHGAMVWDEVVAFMLVLAVVPGGLAWQASAFGAFRLFDIAKPPPIRHLERRFVGGFGVMLDDLVAAGYALLALALAKSIFL